MGCRDTSTEPPAYAGIYIDVRRGRKEGRKKERLLLEAETEAEIVRIKRGGRGRD